MPPSLLLKIGTGTRLAMGFGTNPTVTWTVGRVLAGWMQNSIPLGTVCFWNRGVNWCQDFAVRGPGRTCVQTGNWRSGFNGVAAYDVVYVRGARHDSDT